MTERRFGEEDVPFLAVGIAATLYLILNRLDYLKSEAQLESVLSRESSFIAAGSGNRSASIAARSDSQRASADRSAPGSNA